MPHCELLHYSVGVLHDRYQGLLNVYQTLLILEGEVTEVGAGMQVAM